MGLDLGGRIKKIHFIGIGGAHMSGLAELCALSGISVSGSDANESEATQRLRAAGIPVFMGHSAEHINTGLDMVVYTSAVKSGNPELVRANELNLLVLDRAKLLSLVMDNYHHPVCVSGSHGKTTVTGMVSEILLKGGKNPSIMSGGVVPSIGAAMRPGGPEYFVAEADEYYDAFLKYKPYAGIILNIDMDHGDYFKTFDRLWASFAQFARLISANGALIVHGGAPRFNELTSGLSCQTITYGTSDAVWQAHNARVSGARGASFDAVYCGVSLGRVRLSVHGAHNIDNALSAIATCAFLGLSFDEIRPGIEAFTGAGRRFQYKGFLTGGAKNVTVIDDYAHHPTEIRANLAVAGSISTGRLWCVFQPHTRSRTVEFLEGFAESFTDADKILLLPIFTPPGREESHINISSHDLAASLAKRGADASAVSSFSDAAKLLRERCAPGDLIITMGAGDVYKVSDELVRLLGGMGQR